MRDGGVSTNSMFRGPELTLVNLTPFDVNHVGINSPYGFHVFFMSFSHLLFNSSSLSNF